MSLAIKLWKQRTAFWAAGMLACMGGLGSSQAQSLSPAMWSETLTLLADQSFGGSAGIDQLVPENLSDRIAGSSWELEGDVEYGPSGPPSVTSTMRGTLQSGVNALFAGTAYAFISFEFRVNQIANPPVAVAMVPVTVHSRGAAEATGNAALPASAFAILSLFSPFAGPLVEFEANASNDPVGPGSESFDRTETFSVAPGTIVMGEMVASAVVAAEIIVPGNTSSAMAFVDPVIQVADAIIPGTSASYGDFFTIEFGPGYDALENPTALQNATWSEVKALYGENALRR